jgi:hypothetical protein
VRAWFRQPDGSKEYVEHVGLTKVAYSTRSGELYIDDEFAKKSVTDALSKIMLSLGASADIWLGRFDGNKYVAPAVEPVEDDYTHISVAPRPAKPRLELVGLGGELIGDPVDRGSEWLLQFEEHWKVNPARLMTKHNLDILDKLASKVEGEKKTAIEGYVADILDGIAERDQRPLPRAEPMPVKGARPDHLRAV